MIIRDLKELNRLTAKITGIPIYKVQHAIKEGEFRFLKDWFKDPDLAAVSLPDFGRFELNLSALTRKLRYDILPRLRISPSEDRKQKFRELWKYRRKILEYVLSTRRKPRHNERQIRREEAAALKRGHDGANAISATALQG